VQADVAKVLLAGCDLSAATGGTWNGPNFFACPSGQQGSLSYVPLGSPNTPNTANPTLLAAFRAIGFGPVETTLVANGTQHPLFAYVPYGNFKIVNFNDTKTVCTLQDGALWQGGAGPNARCPSLPTIFHGANGLVYYGWNWSNNASHNAMYIGDTWIATFWVAAFGPPYATVPVDACITFSCKIAGSQAIQGVFTSATYLPVTNHTVVTQSFPVATLTVEIPPQPPPALSVPPPPPPVPPPLPIAVAPTIPIISPIGIAAQVGVATVALQATAAGLLAAGFMRVTVRNRPISMAVAALSGKGYRSKFDTGTSSTNSGIGRFE
jgi:hypothetical protein